MPNQELTRQILDWLKTQPFWLQYAGKNILRTGEVSDELMANALTYLKEDHGLLPTPAARPDLAFEEQAGKVDDEAPLLLEAIKNAVNVNALAEGQSIPIGPQLTLVYGGNGVGKSGYIRIMNNAFSSRGDKTILPNVFKDGEPGDPACEFTFRRTEDPYDLKYPDQSGSAEFTQFCVFDTQSVRAHLDSENTLAFTPSGFEFFELLLQLHRGVKDALTQEITDRRPHNTFVDLFPNRNEVRDLIETLSSQTERSRLDEFSIVSEDEIQELASIDARIASLRQLDKVARIKELNALSEQLEVLVRDVGTVLNYLNAAALDDCRAAIAEISVFEDLTRSEGIAMFEGKDIANVGSPEWRAFIKSAQEYVSKIVREGDHSYPTGKDQCIFCRQNLDDNSAELINDYWRFLKSTAEVELANARRTLDQLNESFYGLPTIVFDETSTTHTYVKESETDLAADLRLVVGAATMAKNTVLAAIATLDSNGLPDPIVWDTRPLENVKIRIEAEKDRLIQSDPQAEIATLAERKALLEDRQRLGQIKGQIDQFLQEAKWVKKAEDAHPTIVTNSITIAQGKLYKEHVTDEYLTTFNQECESMAAPTFIHITVRNDRATTLRRLKVKDTAAMKVLSEGEQRAIALADFMTEARLNPINKGVVFDDPVSSHDHIRRSRIAERIAKLAQIRQVVVFTHDIAFLIEMRNRAESDGVTINTTTIRRVGDTPGIVNDQLPWIIQPLKARVGFLRDRLVQLKKIGESDDEDAYLLDAKAWYGLLREAWERAIEERLFKGVIERFAPGVQTQKLKSVVITQELLDQIEKGMTDASKWVHDSAAGLNPPPPDIATAEAHLDALAQFVKDCPLP